MLNRSKATLNSVVLLVPLLAMAVTPAQSAMVTYSTTGSFNGGGSTMVIFGGGGNTVTLTFLGMNPATTVDTGSSFTFSSLGHIVAAATGAGASITPTTLMINIAQLAPLPGTGALGGSIMGTITQNSSTAQITFTINSAVINGITYAIANNPLALVAPDTGVPGMIGYTSVQAQISGGSTIPEPWTSTLVGLGLIGLSCFRRKHA